MTREKEEAQAPDEAESNDEAGAEDEAFAPMTGNESALARSDKPVIHNGLNYFGLMEAFEREGIRVQLNRLTGRKEFIAHTGEPEEWTDDVLNAIQGRMEVKYQCVKGERLAPFKFTQDGWAKALAAAAEENPVDPVRDYLLACARNVDVLESGERMIWRVMRDWFNLEDTPLNRWAAVAIWAGVAERVIDPGCDQRIMVVLAGEQGCGKSSFLGAMLPPKLQRYYQPSLSLKGELVDMVTATRGMVLIECAELHGASKTDVNAIKARLGPGWDVVRLKYAKEAVRLPRTGCLVGTANPGPALPKDPTGSTRFVMLQSGTKNASARQDLNEAGEQGRWGLRDQLWAAAYRAITEEGFVPGHLPDELAEAQQSVNALYEMRNDIVDDFIDSLPNDPNGISLSDVKVRATGLDLKVAEIVEGLTGRGWRKRVVREDGRQVRKWLPPKGFVGGAAPPAGADVTTLRPVEDLDSGDAEAV